MSAIQTFLTSIKNAIYGSEVRDAIHDSIEQCYADVTEAQTLADTAAANADTKAALAEQKAALADTAAANADTKAALAEDKAALADTAAANAEEKAMLAYEKATLADTAAANADTKAALAEQKATLADTAAANAEEKAMLAYEKATLAETAATNADAKATLAEEKATALDTAAENANEKATLAEQNAALAEQKAGLAETAAANADAKAALAEDKAALTDTAAVNADAKATLAEEKAALADTAAVNADVKATLAEQKALAIDTAAENADTKAALAEQKAALAETAATKAEIKAALAEQKAALADIAAVNADTKAALADVAATNADEKAALAESLSASVMPELNTARSNLGDPTVMEIGMIDEQFTNKLRFYPPSLIAWEQSDDGEVWSELAVDDATNKKLVMGQVPKSNVLLLPKGKLYRFTITRRDYNLTLNALYLYCSTLNASWTVNIDTYNETTGLWTVVTPETNTFWNWPGHVTVRHAPISLYAPSTSTATAQKARVTIRVSSGGIDSYPNTRLNSIQWWGGYPASNRSLYTWDENQAATFPGRVVAPSFSGALTGNATTATKLNTDAGLANQPVYFSDGKPVATTHTLGASVPEDAAFTDTTYEVATETADGLMTAQDKQKLDAFPGISKGNIILYSANWNQVGQGAQYMGYYYQVEPVDGLLPSDIVFLQTTEQGRRYSGEIITVTIRDDGNLLFYARRPIYYACKASILRVPGLTAGYVVTDGFGNIQMPPTETLLWSGSWSSSAITVPYSSDYSMYIAQVGDDTDPTFARCINPIGVQINGMGVRWGSGQTVRTLLFEANVSDNTWTMVRAVFNSSTTTQRSVTQIWGIG